MLTRQRGMTQQFFLEQSQLHGLTGQLTCVFRKYTAPFIQYATIKCAVAFGNLFNICSIKGESGVGPVTHGDYLCTWHPVGVCGGGGP